MRLMAQARSDNRFGQSESKVVVAAPLITQLAIPRFLAGGDNSRLALDLTNLTDYPQTLMVNLQASGLVKLEETASRQVSLSPGQRTTLFIPVSAAMGYGEGSIDAVISGLEVPGETLPLSKGHWTLGVRPARPRRPAALTAWFIPVCHGSCPQKPSAASRQRRCRDSWRSAVIRR